VPQITSMFRLVKRSTICTASLVLLGCSAEREDRFGRTRDGFILARCFAWGKAEEEDDYERIDGNSGGICGARPGGDEHGWRRGAHGSFWSMSDKRQVMARNPAQNPFIDPWGFQAYIIRAEGAFQTELQKERAQAN